MKTIIATITAFALLAAPAGAAVKPGTYRGETDQGKPIKIVVKNALGSGVRIERLKLTAEVQCPGFSRDMTIDDIVIGGTVKKNGRFRIRTASLDMKGRFVNKRVTGSFSASEFDCTVKGVGYSGAR
jgi:hypothetical protein